MMNNIQISVLLVVAILTPSQAQKYTLRGVPESYAVLGENYRLQCDVTDLPSVVSFRRNNIDLCHIVSESCQGRLNTPTDYRYTCGCINYYNKTLYLNINDINEKDDTTWSCRGNFGGQGSTTVPVYYGPEYTRFNPTDDNIDVIEGKSQSVNCFADCKPDCDVLWFKDGSTTTLNNPLSLSTRDQTGSYTCTVEHPVLNKQLTKPLNVQIYYGPDELTFSPDVISIDIIEGSDQNITCLTDCYECNYKWSGPVSSSKNQLVLPEIKRNQEGNYTCEATNIKNTNPKSRSKSILVNVHICSKGTYGSDCNNFCHCSNYDRCDDITGQCPNGCQIGWYGDSCNTSCSTINNYGVGCQQRCAVRQCSGDSTCDHVTGKCIDGCIPGFQGIDCSQECETGLYGTGCSKKCSDRHCNDISKCNSKTGKCIFGCKPGYQAIDCTLDQLISPLTLKLLKGDPDKLLEGTSIEFVCKFRLFGAHEAIKPIVKWFLDEIPLTHTSRIKMRNLTDSGDRFGYQYIIKFVKATPSHSGLLKCMVQISTNSAINTSATETVKIISIPVVTLWPLSTFLQSGESVTLKCSSAISPVSYAWFDAQSNSEIVSARNKDDYTASIVDTDVQVYCKGENLAGTTQSPTATIHHTPSSVETLQCRRSTDARNTTWPSVKAGSNVKLTCGKNYNGFAQRACLETGVWGPPDYSNCRRIKLIGLKRATDDVKEGKLVTNPKRSLQTLASLTTDGKQFSAGDVEVSVQILMDVVDITNDDPKVTIGKPELKNLAQLASNILDADDEEWKTLAEQGKSGIAVMMDTVDAMAKLSSSRLENKEPVTASTDKMVIEIGRSDLSGIEVPRPAASTYPEWLKSSSDKALLRKDTLDNYYKDDKEIGYNAVFYNDISKIVEGKILYPGETINSQKNQTVDINSRILAFSMNPSPTGKLDPPIELSFQHLSDNYSSPTCVFLDLKAPYDKRGRWSTEGCKTESTSNPNVTICKCDHLTNFAILMSPGKTPIKHVEALSIISGVGCTISMCCLLLTIVIYAYLWRYVKSDKSIILMNLCVTLIIAYAIFLGGVNRTDIKAVCQTVAVLLHFFFLVVFFLMLAEGVEVFITLVYVFAMKSRLKWILAGSWGIPVIIVGVSLAITQLEGYGNDDYCWLSLESGLLWAFAGPALAVILVNAIIMVKVLTVMFSTTTMVTKTMKEKGRTGLKALCVLLPIIGLTWVFGIFSVNGYTVTFQFLFAIFNSLQGLFIFIFHCFLNRQVKEAIKIKRRRYRAKSIDTGTKSVTQSNKTRSTRNNDKITSFIDENTLPPVDYNRCLSTNPPLKHLQRS